MIPSAYSPPNAAISALCQFETGYSLCLRAARATATMAENLHRTKTERNTHQVDGLNARIQLPWPKGVT